MFLKCLVATAFFLWRVDCYNVQHDGGVKQKTVEDTVSNGSRKELFNFGDSWVVIQQQLKQKFLHDN